jgi:hypothetical protein
MSIKKSLFLATLLFQISIPVALAADPTYPIISESICEKSATEGGFGGDCQYILIDFSSLGLGETDGCSGGKVFKGYCGETGGDWSDLDYSCCTPAGSTVSQPLVGEAMYRDSTCTLPKASGGSYGGTCKSSCDSATEKYAGTCGETDSPCCVSNDTPTAAETGSLSTSSLSSVGNVNVSTDYIPLENVPFIKDASSFQAYLEGIYILGMVLVVIGAVFMLVIGGFQYLTSAGNTSALSAAKHTIEGALFGLALALVAYLILYVINPDLVKLNITRFQPLPQQAPPTSSGGSGGAGGSGAGTAGGTGYFAAKQSSDVYTDAEARRVLSAAGISVNKANCSSPSQTSCTSLDQIPKSAINFAVALKRDCNCRLIVTGGTEAGHSTHGKNRAALDISRDVSGTIKSTPAISTSGGRPVYSYNGFRVWDEDSAHFHAWEPANP